MTTKKRKRAARKSEAACSAGYEQRRDEWAQAYAIDACRLLGLPIHSKNYNPIACIIKSACDHRPNAHADLSAASADKVRRVVGLSGLETE